MAPTNVSVKFNLWQIECALVQILDSFYVKLLDALLGLFLLGVG